MGVDITINLLTASGINPNTINCIVVLIQFACVIGIIYNVAMAPLRVIELYNRSKNFIYRLKLQCKKPPKSVGAEVDGLNNNLN